MALGAAHGLHAADAVHLATAVAAGANRFVPNNREDFARDISAIEIVYPDDLPDPTDDRPDPHAEPPPPEGA